MDQASTTSVLGITRDTLLPSLKLNSSLSLAAYAAAALSSRVELKDWLWPSGMVANAWYSALSSSRDPSLGVADVVRGLPWAEKTVLFGVTAWGVRLFWHIARRSIRRGGDDPRYVSGDKQKGGFWPKALVQLFLPEAVFQSLIALPFTAPFRLPVFNVKPPNLGDVVYACGVGLFTAGFALEVLADVQQERHKKAGKTGLKTDGVWSIVRHPNYLGDALVHFSFPLMLYSSGKFHPLVLLGPLTNYIFLRFVGGDLQNESYQEARYKLEDPSRYLQLDEWRQKENSFWPGLTQVVNPWTWAIAGIGIGGIVLERGLKGWLGSSA